MLFKPQSISDSAAASGRSNKIGRLQALYERACSPVYKADVETILDQIAQSVAAAVDINSLFSLAALPAQP